MDQLFSYSNSIWAVNDGMSRYVSGTTWEWWGGQTGSTNSLAQVCVGPDGRLWAAARIRYYFGGDTATGSLKRNTGTKDSWVESNIYNGADMQTITRTPDGQVYMAGQFGRVLRYNGSQIVEHSQIPGNPDINQIAVDKEGHLWASSWGKIYRYNKKIDLAATSVTQTSVTLAFNWDDRPIQTFALQRSTDGINFETIANVSGSNYTVTGLTPGTRYYFRLSATYVNYNAMHWQWQSNTVDVRTIPPTPATPTGTTSRVAWDQSVGRSKVVVNWNAVPNANGYKVWVFDGNQYRSFDVGNVTTWDSSVARIYPDPNWLAAQPDNSISGNPFRIDQSGFDLQDNPSVLYRKTVGTTYNNSTNYWFRVSAYNESGESPQSGAYMPTLPNATDSQPPTGSATVTSQEGLEKTFNRNVTVNVSAQDSLSGIQMIELSNEGVNYTTVKTFSRNAANGTEIATHSESFSWTLSPGAGTKTAYVRITDSVGNQRIVTGSIALAEDMLPPSVTLRINNGVDSTTSANVTLTLAATDNASITSQMQMRFSNNGVLWSSWDPFAQTKAWNLTDASFGGNTSAEIKKVYVQIVDAAQNIGLAVAEIGYNPNPPVGTVTVSGGASGTWNGSPALFTASDAPTINLNYSGVSQVRFDTGVGLWGDWEAYATTKRVVLAKSQGVVRLRVQARDASGVAGPPTEHLIVVDSASPVIGTLRGNNGTTATTTSSVTLELIASDNLPGTLQWRCQVNGGIWSSWSNLTGSTVSASGLALGTNRINVQVRDVAQNVAERSVTIWRV